MKQMSVHYFSRCEVLEQKHTKQEDKLTMVKDTIHQLNRQVENVSVLCNRLSTVDSL